MKRTILIVDDEIDMLQLLKRSLEPDLDCVADIATSGEMGVRLFSQNSYDMVLADIKMPKMDGLEFLELIKRNTPDLTVVMMTAYGDIETAVDAMKRGAYDFIIKPFDYDALLLRLEKAMERSRLLKENLRLQVECNKDHLFQNLVGKSDEMKRLYETIQMVAKTEHTVLVTGESGTGKELVARAIHDLSDRRQRRFVAVNCPTVPENILESELFGYKKGAFTHASQNKIGLFQEAHKGTLFLDEIGDISPAIQAKLLRVLQEKEIKPLGDTKSIQIDVRIIASTNQNLEEKIRKSTFRDDFYYRLNVLPIHMPALKEHREDIPFIASYLVKKHCEKLNKPLKKISPDLMKVFMIRTWEGNVREMENSIIRGILFSPGDEIRLQDVGFSADGQNHSDFSGPGFAELSYKTAKEDVLKQFNSSYISDLLSANNGNVTLAAKACGLERQALQQIMRRYNIKSDSFRE